MDAGAGRAHRGEPDRHQSAGRAARIRFCVVDDHMIIHDGLRAMADREPDLEFRGGALGAEDAVELVAREQPDLVLLDLRIGERNRLDLCATLRQAAPATRVLLFTGYGSPELLTGSIRAGAAGYVLKDTNTARLPDALREVHETGSYYDPRLAGGVLAATAGDRPDGDALSEQEVAIIRMIATGATNQDIGQALHMSPHTVKFRITDMLRRFGLRRRSELVHVAMTRQVIE
jgi:two-component system response regulator DevR